jgi:hypothetical protein
VPISKPKIVGRELDYILLRRHDEVGIAGESIILAVGIRSVAQKFAEGAGRIWRHILND